MSCDLLLRLATSGWLIAMSIVDWRTRELPHWGTTWPLIGLSIAGLGSGLVKWTSAGWSNQAAYGLIVGLTFVALLLSDRWWTGLPAVLIAGLVAIRWGDLASHTVLATWVLWFAFEQMGFVGAGDAKLVMALILIYPSPGLSALLLGVPALFGLIVLARRMGPATGAMLSIMLQALREGRTPAKSGIGALGVEPRPLAPMLAVGTLIYLWVGG